MTLRAATRGSTLARAQTDYVAELLGVDVEPVIVETEGDRQSEVPIWAMGGRGVFVKEVQAAVLDGRADFAVHSAKDLPSSTPPGLTIAAVPKRGDARDALVGRRLDALVPGARVGTGSVRRRAQLAWIRPDLTFAGLRGNMETRLSKAGGFAAIVVAAAALDRLGRTSDLTEVLPAEVLVPQVGQGALAVECRAGDEATLAALAAIEDGPSRRAVDAERAWLNEVGGGCDLPVGAHATVDVDGHITMTAMVGTPDGRVMLRDSGEGDDPVELGRRLARHLLDDAGGWSLLAD
ncbi:MAG TPA: hydroxymethylbilane synthase, partial [Actinomycetes bacterium]|nr:hydroxymethylbilane synthase [Actinomycetes bacterium]